MVEIDNIDTHEPVEIVSEPRSRGERLGLVAGGAVMLVAVKILCHDCVSSVEARDYPKGAITFSALAATVLAARMTAKQLQK